jgi:adenosine deaminase
MILALKQNSLTDMQSIPKSDLHNHSARGGRVSYIENWAGVKISPPPKVFALSDSATPLSEMDKWFKENIRPHCLGYGGHLKRWEATFAQAHSDTVAILSISFRSVEIRKYFDRFDDFIKTLTEMSKEFAPNTIILPELTFAREDCDTEHESVFLEEALSHGFFKSIDICGDEFAQPIKNFKKMFKYAKTKRLVLKAHVGEFGTADDVMEAVEELELHEVHHGNAVYKSPQIMNWLAKNRIQLNLCPASNIMLGIFEGYSSYPIKKIFEAGIPITINTDDLLIFNQSLSQEYLNLFNANLLDEYELDKIRETGLSTIYRYNKERIKGVLE